MNEKKLTDEEIVKALDYCGSNHKDKSCEICPLRHVENCYDPVLYDNALDLIRRLQYGYSSASKASEEWKAKYEKERKENAEYEQKLYDGELLSKDYHDEQVSHYVDEVADLLKENKKLKTELQKECREHLAFAELAKKADEQQKDEIEFLTKIIGMSKRKTRIADLLKEIERLTEENVRLDNTGDKLCERVSKLADDKLEKIDEIHYLRRELKERDLEIEELKKKQTCKEERCKFKKKGINEFVEKLSVEMVKQQAVKDRTKEIFDWLQEHLAPTPNGLCILRTYLKERYGVEVE